MAAEPPTRLYQRADVLGQVTQGDITPATGLMNAATQDLADLKAAHQDLADDIAEYEANTGAEPVNAAPAPPERAKPRRTRTPTK